MRFEIGDRVRYVSGRHGDSPANPLWDGRLGQIVGTVSEHFGEYIEDIFSLRVNWDNDNNNSYMPNDLKSFELDIVPKELFEI